jgi:hypothetical protein
MMRIAFEAGQRSRRGSKGNNVRAEMRFKVYYKNKAIGEVFPCTDNQWGNYHYKSDWGEEGLANTTIESEAFSLLDFEPREKDYKDIKLVPIFEEQRSK